MIITRLCEVDDGVEPCKWGSRLSIVGSWALLRDAPEGYHWIEEVHYNIQGI